MKKIAVINKNLDHLFHFLSFSVLLFLSLLIFLSIATFLFLLSLAPPLIITQPDAEEVVFTGATAVLMCTAQGHPTPVVTWLKNLEDLQVDPRFSVISDNGRGVLYIRNVSVFDEGVYSCVVTQSENSIIADQSTNLTVIDCKYLTFKVCDLSLFLFSPPSCLFSISRSSLSLPLLSLCTSSLFSLPLSSSKSFNLSSYRW